MKVKFNDGEFLDTMPLLELAHQIENDEGFKMLSKEFKRVPDIETYDPEEKSLEYKIWKVLGIEEVEG